jgi:subtilisin family serine protease
MTDIGVVVANGLSDADATALAGNDEVARDYEGRWVPTPDELQLSTTTLSPPVEAASAQSPFAAAFLPLQWNMFQIHAPEAWATRTGIPSVRVAILDSGLDPFHIDQSGLIDMAASIAFVPSTKGPPTWEDDFFHGTFVGSIVTSNNIGVAGVAPNVTLVAVKVLGASGSGPIGAVIAGIYYATDVAKVQVINMSLGLALPKNVPGASTLLTAMTRAINHAHSRGVLVVTAAGNDTTDLQHDRNFVELPCEAGVQLCVSATGLGDAHAVYSNSGTNAIDVAAPGGDGPLPPPGHVGGWIIGPCSSRVCGSIGAYVIATGTSASAPHVAGLAAFLDSQFGGQLNASQMRSLIEQNADDIGKRGSDPFFGKGRINVVNTVNSTHP